ncbi:MAG: SCO family protein [Fidelibacterota bacterium]
MGITSRKPGVRVLLYVLFGVVIAAAALVRLSRRPPEPPPVLGILPPFHLVDQNGEGFSRDDLLGKLWLADFIFTTCSGPCPVMSGQFAQFQKRFSPMRDFRLLSISVNPEYDTPAILREYGNRFGADHTRWTFLTGDPGAIHRLAVDGFHVGSIEKPMFHSTRFVLVDSKGQIRGYYISSETQEMARLERDLKSLAAGS